MIKIEARIYDANPNAPKVPAVRRIEPRELLITWWMPFAKHRRAWYVLIERKANA